MVVLIEELGIETDPSLDDVRRQYTDRMNEIVVRNARLDRASIIKERSRRSRRTTRSLWN